MRTEQTGCFEMSVAQVFHTIISVQISIAVDCLALLVSASNNRFANDSIQKKVTFLDSLKINESFIVQFLHKISFDKIICSRHCAS